MVVNRWFSAVARIQQDRGQEVVTTGPYRSVRHPSYAGALLASLALPIMLDAIWSFIPAMVMVVALVICTGLKDQMLRKELEGYQSNSEETPYHLILGLW
jgi:protein-S-isoprenylcysteine O-methyltransferase Ste14